MKKIIIGYICLITFMLMFFACPSVADNGGITGGSDDTNTNDPPIVKNACSTESKNTDKKLYYSKAFKDGVDSVDGLDGAKSVVVSPDKKNVYVASDRDNAVAIFTRDTSTGALTYSTMIKNGGTSGGKTVDGLTGAYSVAVSPDGKNVYVAAKYDNAVVVFTRDTSDGSLTYSTRLKDGEGGVDGLRGARGVAVSFDGKSIYVAGYTDIAVAVFTRDDSDGSLTYSTVIKNGSTSGGKAVEGLRGAYSVAVSCDDNSVYVTGYTDSALTEFTRDTSDGSLTYQKKHALGGRPYGVAVSPDGSNVYVLLDEATNDSISVFTRDASNNGALTYKTVLKDNLSGVDGLNKPYSVTVSPDGNNVYAVGSFDDAVAVFTRDASDNDKLTYSKRVKNAENGVDGLDGAYSVAVSPDGISVYVVGSPNTSGGGLVVFERK